MPEALRSPLLTSYPPLPPSSPFPQCHTCTHRTLRRPCLKRLVQMGIEAGREGAKLAAKVGGGGGVEGGA